MAILTDDEKEDVEYARGLRKRLIDKQAEPLVAGDQLAGDEEERLLKSLDSLDKQVIGHARLRISARQEENTALAADSMASILKVITLPKSDNHTDREPPVAPDDVTDEFTIDKDETTCLD